MANLVTFPSEVSDVLNSLTFPYESIVKELHIMTCFEWYQSVDDSSIIYLRLPLLTSYDISCLYNILGGCYYQVYVDLSGIGLILAFYL